MITIYVDAGVRGNPSDLGAWAMFVVRDPESSLETISGGKCLHKVGKSIPGKVTNNYAEYCGILCALQYAREEKMDGFKIRSDSNLAIQQINGNFKVKKAELIQMHQKIREILCHFECVSFEWVPRTNKWITRVDAFCNEILDEYSIQR